LAHPAHEDEAPVLHHLGDLPARRGRAERILVTVDGENRLPDPGDAALRQLRGRAGTPNGGRNGLPSPPGIS
jgi:hypothetical protein